MGVGRGAVAPLDYTDKVVGGFMVLFFALFFFHCTLLGNFSAEALVHTRLLSFPVDFLLFPVNLLFVQSHEVEICRLNEILNNRIWP